ncbi:MAG: hypothetical protein MR574_04305, partial [Oscillospiraceae bacterium]|nr:hypothetical protein [Oscillospiraceae bacterium]
LRRQGLATKTIFLSGVVSDRVAKKALDLGALHFIPKPFHSRAALDVICGLLHSRPQHPPLFIVIAEKSQHFFDSQFAVYYHQRADFASVHPLLFIYRTRISFVKKQN